MAQDYDVSSKLLFRSSNGVTLQLALQENIVEWLNIELPRVSNPRVDMLARAESGVYIHFELQTANSSDMARREAEYYLDLHRLLGQHVRQVVLYLGAAPLSMPASFHTPVMNFTYELLDIRQFNGETMLASGDLADAILALLTNVDKDKVARRVWDEIERMDPAKREDTITEFLIISGLRNLEDWVLERARTLMPFSIDVILNNKVLGPAFRRHLDENRQEGRLEGRQEGEATIVRHLLIDRFGPLPPEFDTQLRQASEERLKSIAHRAFSASTLQEAFAKPD